MSASSQDRARNILDSVLVSSQPRRSRSGPQPSPSDPPAGNKTGPSPKPLSPVKHPSPFVGFQNASSTNMNVPQLSPISAIPKGLGDDLNHNQSFGPPGVRESSNTGNAAGREPSSDSSLKSPSSSQSKAMDMLSSIKTSRASRSRTNSKLGDNSKMLVEGESNRLHSKNNSTEQVTGREVRNVTEPSSPLKSPSSSQSKAMDMLSSIKTSNASRSRTNSNSRDRNPKELNCPQESTDSIGFKTGKEVKNKVNPNSPSAAPGLKSARSTKLSVPQHPSFSKIPESLRESLSALKSSGFSAGFGDPNGETANVGFITGREAKKYSSMEAPSSSQSKALDIVNSVSIQKTPVNKTNSGTNSNSAMSVEEEPSGLRNESNTPGFTSGKEVKNKANPNSPSTAPGLKTARNANTSVPQPSPFSKIPDGLKESFEALIGSGFSTGFGSPNGDNASVGFSSPNGENVSVGFITGRMLGKPGTHVQGSPKSDFKVPSTASSSSSSSSMAPPGLKSARNLKPSVPQASPFSKIPEGLRESFKELMGSGFSTGFGSPNGDNASVGFSSPNGENVSVGFTTGRMLGKPGIHVQGSPKNDFKVPSTAIPPVTPTGFSSGNGRRLSAPQPSSLSKISKELGDDFKALMRFSGPNEEFNGPNTNTSATAENESIQARNLEKEFSNSQSSSQSKAMDMLNSIRLPTKTPRPIARKRPSSDTKVSGRVKHIQRELESPPPAKISKPEIQIESWSQQASQAEAFSTQDDISFLDKLQCEDIPSQVPQDSKPSETSNDNVNDDENFEELIKDIDMKSMDSDDASEPDSITSHKRDSSPLGNLFSSHTPTKTRYPAPVVLKSGPQSAQKTKALGSATRMFKQGRPFQTPMKGRVFVSPGKKIGSTDGSVSGSSVNSSPSRNPDTPLERSGERRRSLKVIPPPPLVHKYSLKDLEIDCGNKRTATIVECLQYKVLTQVIEMTSMSATTFRFRIVDFVNELPTGLTCTGDTIGPEDLISLLKVSVDSPHLLTESWVRNQWRWVVWKLASYERRFPSVFGGKYLTPRNVFQELCHRYNKERSKSRRSALKRIFEKDDISSRYMVLCVSSVSVPPPAVPEDQQSQEKAKEATQQGNASDVSDPNPNCLWIELTDGWYPVKVQLDEYLSKALMCGKIYEGQKLRICGAQRCGSDSGQDPLEAPDSVWFRIFVNGTRRAEWDAKLGFQKSKAFTVSLFSLKDMGGPIPSVEVCVLRVYPPIYSERIDGEGDEKRRVVRTEREEEWEVRAFEQKFERMFEQKLSEYSRVVRGDSMAGVHERVSSEVQKEMEKSRRDVTKILRFRVRDCPSFLANSPYSEADDGAKFKETILSVTAPQESNEVDIKEGSWIKFYGVGAYKRRSPVSGVHDFPEKEIPLHLSVSGSLPWRLLYTKKGSPAPPTFVPRQICRADTVGNQCGPGDEFDFVGIAVAFGECILETGEIADPKRDRGEPIDLFLYATDTSENIMAILIHTRMGFQPKFSVGEVFTAANLLYSRFDSENDIHVCDASDTVVFNQKPVKPHLAKAKAELVEWAAKSSSAIETAVQRTSLIIDGITLSQLQ